PLFRRPETPRSLWRRGRHRRQDPIRHLLTKSSNRFESRQALRHSIVRRGRPERLSSSAAGREAPRRNKTGWIDSSCAERAWKPPDWKRRRAGVQRRYQRRNGAALNEEGRVSVESVMAITKRGEERRASRPSSPDPARQPDISRRQRD